MAVFNVQYSQRPFLTLQGVDAALPWEEGSLLTYRMKSNAMQLSATSLKYYAGDSLRALDSWGVFNCSPTVRALCASDTGVTLMGTSPVVVPFDLSGPMAASHFLRAFNGSVCNAADTKRSVGRSDVYTVSMCDLSERMLRFVVRDTDAGMLVYWKAESTPGAENVILALVALYASINIANNTIYLISAAGAQQAFPSAGAYHVLTLTALSLALFVVCQQHADFYVSAHDYSLYVVLATYLLLEVCLVCAKLSQTSRKAGKLHDRFHFGYNINISTAILLLATLRLHSTFDTPFFGVLFAVFGVRTACKLLQQLDDDRHTQSSVNAASVLIDLFVWSCLLAYGLSVAEDVYAQLAVATCVMVGLMLGLFMAVLIERKAAKACSSE